MHLLLPSTVTRKLLIAQASYCRITKLRARLTPKCKKLNIRKCGIVPGFCRSGHICVCLCVYMCVCICVSACVYVWMCGWVGTCGKRKRVKYTYISLYIRCWPVELKLHCRHSIFFLIVKNINHILHLYAPHIQYVKLPRYQCPFHHAMI